MTHITRTPDYKTMESISIKRLQEAEFDVGMPVLCKGRNGVIERVNPFFHDMNPLKVYVRLEATEKKKESLDLVSVEMLGKTQ